MVMDFSSWILTLTLEVPIGYLRSEIPRLPSRESKNILIRNFNFKKLQLERKFNFFVKIQGLKLQISALEGVNLNK